MIDVLPAMNLISCVSKRKKNEWEGKWFGCVKEGCWGKTNEQRRGEIGSRKTLGGEGIDRRGEDGDKRRG